MRWLKYAEAAVYTGLAIATLRNMVSAEVIPVYGPKGGRRFRCDMLDAFLEDRDAALRKFRAERRRQ